MASIAADARWNTWAQRGPNAVRFLVPGQAYDIKLDLSRYAYLEQLSARAAVDVRRLVAEKLAAGEPTLRLKVRPRVLGNTIERQEGARSEYTLTVDLERMTQPGAQQAASEAAWMQRFRDGRINIPALAEALGAGSIALPVMATQSTGCAYVVFSIWDESGLRPLDHLVHALSVRGAAQPAPECESQPVQGGFNSMTGIVTSMKGVQADAALQFIEVPTADKVHTVALYVDAAAYAQAQADPQKTDRGVYSWELPTPLSTLVGDNRQLLALVNTARQSGSYKAVALRLSKALFPPALASQTDTPQRRAAQSLRRLSARPGNAPVVLLRASDARQEPIYLPLGLLAAKDAGQLDRRITVVQPLRRERYGAACIDRWTLAIPSRLEAYGQVIDLDRLPQRMQRAATLKDFEDYLNPPTVDAFAPAPARPAPVAPALPALRGSEALVVLAHQEAGKLWFTGRGQGESVDREEYTRSFPAGSVAVLAACAAASPRDDNQFVLGKLNELGVDAVLASPFPVEVSWGVEFARQFTALASAAYAQRQAPTLRELFDRAVDGTARALGSNAPSGDKALEFMIIGDHELRLCDN